MFEPDCWQGARSSQVVEHHPTLEQIAGQSCHPGSGMVRAHRSDVVGSPVPQPGRDPLDCGWHQDWFRASIADRQSGLSQTSHPHRPDVGQTPERTQQCNQTDRLVGLRSQPDSGWGSRLSCRRLRIWLGSRLATAGSLALVLCSASEIRYMGWDSPEKVETKKRQGTLKTEEGT